MFVGHRYFIEKSAVWCSDRCLHLLHHYFDVLPKIIGFDVEIEHSISEQPTADSGSCEPTPCRGQNVFRNHEEEHRADIRSLGECTDIYGAHSDIGRPDDLDSVRLDGQYLVFGADL